MHSIFARVSLALALLTFVSACSMADDAAVSQGNKLLDEGDRLADQGSVHRGRHPLQTRHGSSSCRASARSPSNTRSSAT